MSASLHFFAIPALAPAQAQAELNHFLLTHRVVNLEKQWVTDGAASFWGLCLTVEDGAGPLPSALRAPGQGGTSAARSSAKVDYREVLNEADFAHFAQLRNLRAALAQAEGVPTYAVFTNEQLACFVRQRAVTAEQLRAVDGVGDARIAKYASHFVPELQRLWGAVP